MLKNKKILTLLVVILIIIIGIVVTSIKGLNYGLIYGENTTVELYIESEFQDTDVENIIKEALGNNVKIRTVNNLKGDILITTRTVSDDQINLLLSKINEKYSLELTNEDIIITNNSKINEWDLINPYILPVTITSILTLIYFMIRYKKIGIFKQLLPITILTIIIVQLLYFSIYSITRIPVNQFTMPISMILFIISLLGLTENFERKLENLKKSQKE